MAKGTVDTCPGLEGPADGFAKGQNRVEREVKTGTGAFGLRTWKSGIGLSK